MSVEKVHGGVGVVVLSCMDEQHKPYDLKLTIQPMSLAAERVLHADLRTMAVQERRKLIRESLGEFGGIKKPTWADEVVVRELSGKLVETVTFADVMAQRFTPDGIAMELFHRCRAAHPKVTLKELESAVTVMNAGEIREQLDAILQSGQTDKKSGPADAGD